VIVSGFAQAMTVLGHALPDVGIDEMAFEDLSIERFRRFAAGTGRRIVHIGRTPSLWNTSARTSCHRTDRPRSRKKPCVA
jgi:hypothetical protein